MIGGQRDHAVPVAQHIADHAGQGTLGTHFDEDACALGIEGLQPVDKLNRRGDLLAEQVDDLVDHAVAHGVELTADVADHRQHGVVQAERGQDALERFARRRHDGGVEGVAHR